MIWVRGVEYGTAADLARRLPHPTRHTNPTHPLTPEGPAMPGSVDLPALTAAREWAEQHVHPQPDDRMLRTYGVALLHDLADLIDRGPAIPLPPDVFSALVRERANDLANE